jgi:hypothetical protein
MVRDGVDVDAGVWWCLKSQIVRKILGGCGFFAGGLVGVGAANFGENQPEVVLGDGCGTVSFDQRAVP